MILHVAINYYSETYSLRNNSYLSYITFPSTEVSLRQFSTIMVFYKNEYRIFKTPKITIRGFSEGLPGYPNPCALIHTNA
jgi:hypothetical protein